MSGLTILYRLTGNGQNFARIKLSIKLISDSVCMKNNQSKLSKNGTFIHWSLDVTVQVSIIKVLISTGVYLILPVLVVNSATVITLMSILLFSARKKISLFVDGGLKVRFTT